MSQHLLQSQVAMIFSFLPDRDPTPASLLLNGGISSIRLNISTFLQLPIISVNILTGAGQGAHLDPLPRAFSRALALHCIALPLALHRPGATISFTRPLLSSPPQPVDVTEPCILLSDPKHKLLVLSWSRQWCWWCLWWWAARAAFQSECSVVISQIYLLRSQTPLTSFVFLWHLWPLGRHQ